MLNHFVVEHECSLQSSSGISNDYSEKHYTKVYFISSVKELENAVNIVSRRPDATQPHKLYMPTNPKYCVPGDVGGAQREHMR